MPYQIGYEKPLLHLFSFYTNLFLWLYLVLPLGHSTVRIEVRKLEDENLKINFITAIVRFVIKSFLGWISLLTISGSDKRQAIHDKVAQSVVVFSKN